MLFGRTNKNIIQREMSCWDPPSLGGFAHWRRRRCLVPWGVRRKRGGRGKKAKGLPVAVPRMEGRRSGWVLSSTPEGIHAANHPPSLYYCGLHGGHVNWARPRASMFHWHPTFSLGVKAKRASPPPEGGKRNDPPPSASCAR